MSTLPDIESIGARFSPEELAALERIFRQMRLEKTRSGGQPALDLPPLELGHMLEPLGTREERMSHSLARGPRHADNAT